jgi:tripartite-type tricarboxylate transporter receptor subunit TctC
MKQAAACLSVCLALILAQPATAQPMDGFYKGKQLHMIVGYPAGSGYDFYSRLLAGHLTRHISGQPGIVVQNMVGAASLKAANYLYNAAPRDGTYLGAINRSIPLAPILQTIEKENIQFDPLKFTWIGSIEGAVAIGFVWAATGIQSFEDTFKREVVVSATSPSSDSYMLTNMLNNLLGTKFKIISGYPGSNDNFLAVERGEVQGYFGSTFSTMQTTRPEWLTQKKVNILIQIALTKDPALPDVPLVTDYAKSKTAQNALKVILAPLAASRPYLAPPNLPQERAVTLQTAFDETMRDPAFVADAKKSKIDVTPMTGEQIKAMLMQIYNEPEETLAAARAALKLPAGVTEK